MVCAEMCGRGIIWVGGLWVVSRISLLGVK